VGTVRVAPQEVLQAFDGFRTKASFLSVGAIETAGVAPIDVAFLTGLGRLDYLARFIVELVHPTGEPANRLPKGDRLVSLGAIDNNTRIIACGADRRPADSHHRE
jgi:hypothetical protein